MDVVSGDRPAPRNGGTPHVIAVDKLRKTYGGVRALDGVSFAVENGMLFGIVGPNGAGKSTLFDVIAGAALPSSGTVTLDGRRIDGLPVHAAAASGVARTRQATRLFPSMTTLENVVAGAHLRSTDSFAGHLMLAPSARRVRASVEAAARGVLNVVGLGDRLSANVMRLTEGERRRVALARAMVSKPKVLLLDELGAGLDIEETALMHRAVTAFAREHEAVVLVAERDISSCLDFCERVLVLHAGQTIAQGPPETARHDPDVRDAYLGVEWRQ
jgi:branched-chain amino acid transport system ATP-binding protein